MSSRKAWAGVVLATLSALLVLALPAFAYDEPHNRPEVINGGVHGDVSDDCNSCHRAVVIDPSGSADCLVCHNYTINGVASPTLGKGPHGCYSTASNRCDACHEVHAAGGLGLLPKSTVTATCYVCHDGTGGHGVFGTIKARGLTAGAVHRIDTTNAIPGGDSSTGATSTATFGGPNGSLGCDDCHSPHDSRTVASFTNERQRTSLDLFGREHGQTNRLLRQNPAGSTTTATVYGSDWCIACHKGRSSAGVVHNHPADSNATTSSPFYYQRLAIMSADTTTSTTVLGSLAKTNRGYLMPYPRTAQQAGHAPICQQCHEDSRNAGVLTILGDAADAATYSVTATDGNVVSDNPRFQNFPHETVNARLLVERDDDLCLNCHPPAGLP